MRTLRTVDEAASTFPAMSMHDTPNPPRGGSPLRSLTLGLACACAVLVPLAPAGAARPLAPQTAPQTAPQAAPEPAAPPVLDLAVNVRSSALSGRFLLRAGAYDPGSPSSFSVDLRRAGQPGDSLRLGSYADAVFSAPVVAGVYQPEYTYLYGDAAPRNRTQRLATRVNARHAAVQDIDVPSVDVTADVLLDGQPFPQQAGEVARFYLVPTGGGERILLATSNVAAPPVSVLPGTYDVVYAYVGGSAIPVNSQAVVARHVRLRASRHLALRVRSVDFESRVTLNGAAFPNSAYDYGKIFLVNAEDGDEVELGDTFSPLPTRRLIVGTYAAHYRVREANGIVPRNPDAVIAAEVVVSKRSPRATLDVHAISIAGQFQLDGSAPPVSAYDYGRVGLRAVGAAADAVLTLGNTYEQAFGPVPVVAGTYQAVYSHREGRTLPANTEAVFIDKLTLAGDGLVVLDIPTVALTLDPSLDGGPFPNSAYDIGDIDVVPAAGSTLGTAPVRMGNTLQGPLQVTLLPGRYDFVYACRECNGQVPANRHAVFLAGTELSAAVALAHDFRSRSVRLSATLNGEPFPADPGAAGEVFLGLDEADRVSLGMTSDGPAFGPVRLLRGAYQATYSLRARSDADGIPVNRHAVVGTFTID